eukprot:1332784-Rhodomonas_salina.1
MQKTTFSAPCSNVRARRVLHEIARSTPLLSYASAPNCPVLTQITALRPSYVLSGTDRRPVRYYYQTFVFRTLFVCEVLAYLPISPPFANYVCPTLNPKRPPKPSF